MVEQLLGHWNCCLGCLGDKTARCGVNCNNVLCNDMILIILDSSYLHILRTLGPIRLVKTDDPTTLSPIEISWNFTEWCKHRVYFVNSKHQ